MTIIPLPNWGAFIKIFIKTSIDKENLLKPWLHEGEKGGWLSRSAWSLAIIALWKSRELNQNRPLVIWIPDYFCNEPLKLLRLSKAKLFFYPVNEEFEPNYTQCKTHIFENPPDIFLLVHYFGKPAKGGTAKEFCKINKCWLIEDAAHVLKPVSGIGEYGDFVIYSPHKLLPIFDGAVLIIRKKGPSNFNETYINNLGSDILWVKELIYNYKDFLVIYRNSILTVKWLLKRFLQKFGFNRIIIQNFRTILPSKSELGILNPQMTFLSLKLLKAEILKLGRTTAYRKRHLKIWINIFQNNKIAQADDNFQNEGSEYNKWVPYYAVIKGAGELDDQFNIFQNLNTKVTTWPDLPPEVIADEKSHSTAIFLRHSLIFFPVHQGISGGEFGRILKNFSKLYKFNDSFLTIKENTTQENWDEHLKLINQSNLLQSWAYGNAKAKTEGWNVKRLVFLRNEIPVAIVQILEKRIMGLIKVQRVNRGPLFFSEATSNDIMDVLGVVIRFGNFFKGKILSIAPELILTGANLVALLSNKVHNYNPHGWKSIWIDLSPSIDQLRSNLSSKWRNKLGLAEKNNIIIEIGSSTELFNWMVEKYEQNMNFKNFEGIFQMKIIC